VALGIAYQKKGDLAQARAFTSRALAKDVRNPGGSLEPGAMLGQEGDSLKALYYLRQSYQADPQGPQTVTA
jgi:Tfp pilus assembly protein PilF